MVEIRKKENLIHMLGKISIITILTVSFIAGSGLDPSTPFQASALANAASSTYTVYKSGSSYYVLNTSTNKVTLSNTNFSNLMNSLNSRLVTNDVVLIRNGVYSVSAMISLTKNRITIMGEGSTVLQATSTLSSRILQVYPVGSYINLKNLIFDANYNTKISPVVLIGGSYNVVQYCELRNAIQYGIQAWKADHFQFVYNTIKKAQYGLCTGGDIYKLATDGLIAYNKIYDCRDCGVKLKWAKNVVVRDNYVDVGYLTWTKNSSGSSTIGAVGIRFYTDDGPNYNCVASNNVIVDSKKNRVTTGVMQDADRRLANPSAAASYGISINGNSISGTYYGLLLKKISQVKYSDNTFSGIRGRSIAIW